MKGTGWSLVKHLNTDKIPFPSYSKTKYTHTYIKLPNFLRNSNEIFLFALTKEFKEEEGGRGEVINRRSSLMARSDLKDVDGAHDERQRRSMESSEKIGHALSSTSVFSPLLLREETREPRIPEANVGGKVHLG